MFIKRELVVNAIADDGEVLEEGKTYAFDIEEGKCLVGKYNGITKRGALSFESVVSGALVTFNVMPASILSVKKVGITYAVKGDK